MSSERLMYVQFKLCVKGVHGGSSILKNVRMNILVIICIIQNVGKKNFKENMTHILKMIPLYSEKDNIKFKGSDIFNNIKEKRIFFEAINIILTFVFSSVNRKC